MSRADKIMGETQLPEMGFDREGFPVTAGGERVDQTNYRTKDRYLKERAILENYNKIKSLNTELVDMRNPRRDEENGGNR